MRRFEVPLKFNDKPTWKNILEPPSTQYIMSPYQSSGGGSAQPVLADRILLDPDIDLNRYRCKAVIDWIEVGLRTDKVHQALNLQRYAQRALAEAGSSSSVYVSGPCREHGHMGSEFILRLQQPEPLHLIEFCKKIVSHYQPSLGSVRNLPIMGIEVSVDFIVLNRSQMVDDTAELLRMQMTDLLRRHLKPSAVLTEAESCRPRFFAKEDGKASYVVSRHLAGGSAKQLAETNRLGLQSSSVIPLKLGSHRFIPVDTTSYIGGKDTPVMLRVMDKITDQRDPRSNSVVHLPPEHRRSRVEVTLRAENGFIGGPAAVELSDLEALYGYEFKRFRKPFFEFFLPTFSPTDEMAALPFEVNVTEGKIFERSGVYGLDRAHRAINALQAARYARREITSKPSRLGKKGRLVSYVQLNNKIDRALRRLTRRWSQPSLRLAAKTR